MASAQSCETTYHWSTTSGSRSLRRYETKRDSAQRVPLLSTRKVPRVICWVRCALRNDCDASASGAAASAALAGRPVAIQPTSMSMTRPTLPQRIIMSPPHPTLT